MALTITSVEAGYAGNKRVNRGRLSLDNNYPTGGYPVTAQQLGLSVVEFFEAMSTQGYQIVYDAIARTLRVFALSALSLVGGQAPGDVVQIGGTGVLGKTTAGNLTSVPVEAAAGSDLSAVTGVQFRAEGV